MSPAEPMVAVHPDDAVDIITLLATVEDWLRHASDDTRDELARFTGHTPSTLAGLIDELGHQACRLRHALTTTPDRGSRP